MVKFEPRAVLGIVIGIIFSLTFVPVLGALVSGAQTYTYTTYTTLNPAFTDNDTENCPEYWDNVITDNRQVNWSQPDERVWDNGDNGTSSWYQSLSVTSLHEGISSARIQASFQLVNVEGILNFTAWVYLDNGTDNIVIWQDSTAAPSGWLYIDNDVTSYITTAGTYYIHVGENIDVAGDNDIVTYWDDASLVVIGQTADKTTAQTSAELIPLFFIIGIFLSIVYVISNSRKK